MRKSFIVILFILTIANQYSNPINVFGYSGGVHNSITSTAVRKEESKFNERLKEIGFDKGNESTVKGNAGGNHEIWEWISWGSEWEDYILWNYYYLFLTHYRGPLYSHYYNPLTKTGLLDSNNTAVGQSLIERANYFLDNEWSYPVAKKYLFIALTGDGTALNEPDE